MVITPFVCLSICLFLPEGVNPAISAVKLLPCGTVAGKTLEAISENAKGDGKLEGVNGSHCEA